MSNGRRRLRGLFRIREMLRSAGPIASQISHQNRRSEPHNKRLGQVATNFQLPNLPMLSPVRLILGDL